MSYEYAKERKFVFTESGIRMLLTIRDRARKLLDESGAFREQELIRGLGGDSWNMLACVDYLVERGDIVCVRSEHCMRQHFVYVGKE